MMNTTEAEETVLKTDVLGRIKMPRERREKILDEFEGSGLSGRKFAGLIGINYQTFATWAQQRGRERKQSPAKFPAKSVSQVRWLEAVVEQKNLPSGSSQSVLAVYLLGGARMEIADANQAALAVVLLRSLELLADGHYVKFCGQPENFRGAGGVRYAQRLQWPLIDGDGTYGRRSEGGSAFYFHQSAADAG